MAVNAAHLTRTINEKPSIFEVIAQESLQAMIQPALKKVVEFLALCGSKKANWSIKWFDEVYLACNTILQYHYLRNTASSFAENFYGLQRLSLKSQMFSDGIHLSPRDEKLSILMLTLFPYLRQKLNQLAQKYTYDEIDGVTAKKWQDKFRKYLTIFNAYFHLIYELLCLVQFLAYMSGKSNSHNLLLRILSLSLVYAPNTVPNENGTWSSFWNNISKGNIRSAKLTFEMIGTALLRSMELGAFFIQFVRWWEDKGPHLNSNALPIPEPPVPDIRASQYINKCPICFQNWKIPTILPVSGYIYCYKCIIRCLNEDQRCPVTKFYTHKDDLIRLYL